MGDNLKVGNKVMSFFRRQDWEGFLMGFISVFLGIVLTFGGEAMISNHNENQDVRNVLILVRDELNTNIEMITDVDEELKKQKDAAVYLMRHCRKRQRLCLHRQILRLLRCGMLLLRPMRDGNSFTRLKFR